MARASSRETHNRPFRSNDGKSGPYASVSRSRAAEQRHQGDAEQQNHRQHREIAVVCRVASRTFARLRRVLLSGLDFHGGCPRVGKQMKGSEHPVAREKCANQKYGEKPDPDRRPRPRYFEFDGWHTR